MRIVRTVFEMIVSSLGAGYIKFVFFTSKISKRGYCDLLENLRQEQFVMAFWHGDSYCMYPIMKGEKLMIVTTEDERGNYISRMGRKFGYLPIRVSDKMNGGKSLIRMKNIMKHYKNYSIGVTIDGPLGPYHEPKSFPFVVGYLTNRRVLPILVRVQRKIRLKKRWDKYVLPLPFNRLEITVCEPLEIKKEDSQDNFESVREKVRYLLKGEI